MTVFAYFQYWKYTYSRGEGRGPKSLKVCLRNIWMVPRLRMERGIIMSEKLLKQQWPCSLATIDPTSGLSFISICFRAGYLFSFCALCNFLLKSTYLDDLYVLQIDLWAKHLVKGGFFSESAMCFLYLQISKKKYSKKLSWAWNLNFPPKTLYCY